MAALHHRTASVQGGSSHAGQEDQLWGLIFLLALQTVNYDQSGCSRGALREGKNDGAPYTAFVADGGCPGLTGHGVEEDLCMQLEQKQQWGWICLQTYPAGSCYLGGCSKRPWGRLTMPLTPSRFEPQRKSWEVVLNWLKSDSPLHHLCLPGSPLERTVG